MALLDAILRVVTKQGGDALTLSPGAPPTVRSAGKALSLFLPPMPERAIRDLWLDLGGDAPGQTEHSVDGLGTFTVRFSPEGTLVARQVGSGAAAEPAAEPTSAAPASDDALDRLLRQAHERGASDLHLADDEPPRVRIDGALTHHPGEAGPALAALIERLDAATPLAAGRSAEGAFTLAGGPRVRASVYRFGDGHAAALRLLPGQAPTLASLDLPVDLSDIPRLPHGLVLVCGPTGSGKSTTLAALARATLEARGGALITLEDPVEYTLAIEGSGALVRQRQIGRDVVDFAAGLRDALRGDPDVLLVGEMRDPETISLAMTAAETGHLVLASLHSRSARSAVERIVDSYPPERQRQVRVQLADALRISIAQRLLPRRAGRGRVVAMEVMRVNHNVAGLIREGRTAQLASALQGGGDEGMMTLERCLTDLVRTRVVSPKVGRDAADDPAAFDDYLR